VISPKQDISHDKTQQNTVVKNNGRFILIAKLCSFATLLTYT